MVERNRSEKNDGKKIRFGYSNLNDIQKRGEKEGWKEIKTKKRRGKEERR